MQIMSTLSTDQEAIRDLRLHEAVIMNNVKMNCYITCLQICRSGGHLYRDPKEPVISADHEPEE